MKKIKIITILGATSTGKSDLAVTLAKLISTPSVLKDISPLAWGEIISADSRQVYKGMDLGTGKVSRDKKNNPSYLLPTTYYFHKGIPHHLIDVVSPNTNFSVSKFKKLAEKKIKEIVSRGNIPILCGGTGFYIDAVINDIVFPEVKPNKKLRKELENKSTSELFKILNKLDKNRAKNIDKNNPARLIRAIEIAKALGYVPPICVRQDLTQKYNVFKITLDINDDVLKERIHKRILKRIKQGMFKEFEKLHEDGLSYRKMEKFGLEYKYGAQYSKGEIDKNEFIEKLYKDTWQYAKRQKTWFKRDKNTIWINPLSKKDLKDINNEIKNFLN